MKRRNVWALIDPKGRVHACESVANSEHALWREYGFETEEKIAAARTDGYRVVCGTFEETGPL